MVAVIFIVIVADNRPWLPPENISLGQPAETITAYVLHYDEHNLAMLRGSRPRQVFYVLEPHVTKREICGGASLWWDVSVLKNLLGLTPFPPCVEPA
jgi:hypothetical protein